MKKLSLIYCLFVFCFFTGTGFGYTSEECIDCHASKNQNSHTIIALNDFKISVHHQEDIGCIDCHQSISDETHQTQKSQKIDCSECHDQENKHGRSAGVDDRPRCYSCHTKHAIQSVKNPLSSVHPLQIENTCRPCHPGQIRQKNLLSVLPSIKIASHGKQDLSMAYEKNNCVGCHQGNAAHGEKTKIDDQNCHVCHLTKNGESALFGYFHPVADIKSQPAVFWVAILEAAFVVFLIFAGLGIYLKRKTVK